MVTMTMMQLEKQAKGVVFPILQLHRHPCNSLQYVASSCLRPVNMYVEPKLPIGVWAKVKLRRCRNKQTALQFPKGRFGMYGVSVPQWLISNFSKNSV